MKILKKGKMPTHKFVCDTCGTQFIANFDEYETSVHDTLDDGVNGICPYRVAVVYKCKCPLCDSKIGEKRKMNLNDITAEGFVNTDRLENTLVHIVNEKKDSEKGPLSYIDTRLFVKEFMDMYESYFRISIDDCYKATYNNIFLGIASSLKAEEDKEDQNAKQ